MVHKTPIYILDNGLGHGGTSKFARIIANSLCNRYNIIFIDCIALSQCNKSFEYILGKIGILRSLVHLLVFIVRYTRILSNSNGGISLSLNPVFHVLNIISSKISPVTPVIAIHEYPIKYPWISKIGGFSRIFTMKLCKYFNIGHIIAVSDRLCEHICTEHKISKDNVTVLYNPVDLDDIYNKSLQSLDEVFFNDDIPIIISVGSVIPVKGQWHLLRVFERLSNFVPCKLVICGDTTRDTHYMHYLSEILYGNMNYKDNVMFTGWTDNPYKYMRKSTLFVLSSLSESWGYCLVEALACGIPIVSTNCISGPAEILENGNYGLLSKPLDETYYDLDTPLTSAENDMMEKILYLLENPDVRQDFARKGIERAKDFDKEVTIKKYIQYFESLN